MTQKFVILTIVQEPGQEARVVNTDVVEVPKGARFVTVTCIEEPQMRTCSGQAKLRSKAPLCSWRTYRTQSGRARW